MNRELMLVKNQYGIMEEGKIKYVLYKGRWAEVTPERAEFVRDKDLILELHMFLNKEQDSLITVSKLVELVDNLNSKIFDCINTVGEENYMVFSFNSIGYSHSIDFYNHQLWFNEEDEREYLSETLEGFEVEVKDEFFEDEIIDLLDDTKEPLPNFIIRRFIEFKNLLLKINLS